MFDPTVYLTTIGLFAATLVLLKLFELVAVNQLERLARRTRTQLDDSLVKVLQNLNWPFYLIISLYLTSQLVDFPQLVAQAVSLITAVVIAYYLAVSLQIILEYALHQALRRQEKQGQKPDPLITNVLAKLIKAAVWIGVGIVLLQNLGVNVSAIIGGLGIGGLAIAFALKEVLGDIMAYFSIHFDRPFQEGDSIVIGEDQGTVKHIGLKSTRLLTVQGEELIIPNRHLTESRVRNFKKMEKRRVVFKFGVAYETSTSQLKQIPKIIKEIFAARKKAELDRVHLIKLGDFSLNYELVYHFLSRDYQAYLDTQQAIALAILKQFEKEGIKLAYPTQKVFLEKI